MSPLMAINSSYTPKNPDSPPFVWMMQRTAIARALISQPEVLLADEPTGNLDPDTSKDIMDLLERINRTGTTVLMATHDHHIVDSMRQRVVELELGRLIRDEQRGVYGMDR